MSLDDKVCKFLPEIKNAFIINEQGERRLVGENITIRHLFTMTAGFTYNLSTPPILRLVEESQGKATLQNFITAFIQTPLAFSPGKRFEYSICLDVLAAVVEAITDKKFSQQVRDAVFAPMGMKTSRFDNGETDVLDCYIANEQGEVVKTDGRKLLLPTPAYESGGAGLVSTVEDYALFADALACGGVAKNGYQLIGEEALRQLSSPQLEKISVDNGFTCVQGEDYGYGLGVRVRQKATDWGLAEGEFGWDGAAGSYLMVDPNKRVSVVIGMHVRNWPVIFTGKHLQIVEKIYKEYFYASN